MKRLSYISKYVWVLNLVLLLALGWAAARVTSTGVRAHYTRMPRVEPWKPPPSGGSDMESTYPVSIEKIEARNVFKAKVKEETETSAGPGEQKLALTPLDIELMGIARGPGWAFATILEKKSKEKKVLAVGDEVQPGVQIAAIEDKKVVFKRDNGEMEELPLDYNRRKQGGGPRRKRRRRNRSLRGPKLPDYAKGVKKVSETEYLIDRDAFRAAMENMNELITQMLLRPNFTPDRQVDGFRIFRLRPSSIFAKLGLRNGDVIQRINGVELDDASKGMEYLLTLKDQRKFTIDLKRGVKKMTFNYEVR